MKETLSDINLVEKCLKKDRLAQKTLYNRYKDAMYTLAFRITGSHIDAEDVLQEGFVNVFVSLPSFKGISTIGAWIKTIIVRTAIKKSRPKFYSIEINDSYNDDEFYIDENLTGEYIEQAILSLDPGYRSVFILIEVEGYKHKEVSEMLNISVGTSKSQLFHAKKHLQKSLIKIYN